MLIVRYMCNVKFCTIQFRTLRGWELGNSASGEKESGD